MVISVSVACGCGALLRFGAGCGAGWSVAGAFVAFFGLQFFAGRLFRKRMAADMQAVQSILADGQKQIQQKVQRWQIRPPGSLRAAQDELAADMRVFVDKALRETEKLSRYRLWVPLVSRQTATAQLQLHWMVKNFDKVDELMPRAILADPSLVAMKMARMYMKGEDAGAIEKFYRKSVRRARYNANVLPAACMAWILLRKNDENGAFSVLTDALGNSDDATLKSNHAHLANNRAANFSNSGLGDAWYALHLEEPKTRQPRQHRRYR